MEEYNKSIEELLNNFEGQQTTKIAKQVNMQSDVPIGSVGSNILNPNNYEQGETSNPLNIGSRESRITMNKKAYSHRRRQTINEELKPENPLSQEPIPNGDIL